MIKHILTLVVALASSSALFAADTLFVSAIAEPGGDGQSWNAPYRSLTDALANATFGDELWVAKGNYPIATTIVMPNGVRIYGGFRGNEVHRERRDWFRNETILDANGGAATLFTMSDADSLTRLDGLVLQGATSSAVIVERGTPTFFNCRFFENGGTNGGGISATGVGRMRIEYCVFAANSATGKGGGLYIADVLDFPGFRWGPFIAQTLFDGNTADQGGGAWISSSIARPQFASTAFNGNTAMNGGGALASDVTTLYVTNCTFHKNTISAGEGYSVMSSGAYIQNSIFWNGDLPDEGKHIVHVAQVGDTSKIETRALLVEKDFDLGFWQSNPNFEDGENIYGPDGFFGTDDDGLRLSSLSPVRDAGVIDGFVTHQAWDAMGDPRLVGRKIDLGVFETQRSGRLNPKEVMAELRRGELVIFFRHAKTDWQSNDPGPSPECFPGRNLITEGREQSRNMGKVMVAERVPVGDALSSPVCRCWETLQLMVNFYEKKDHWAGQGGPNAKELRDADLMTPTLGAIRVISSHDNVAQQVFNPDGTGETLTTAELQEGDGIIMRPKGDSYEVIAQWTSETWTRYHVRFPEEITSVDDENGASSSVRVYPNPAEGDVTVEVQGLQTVSIYNMLGHEVLSVTVDQIRRIGTSTLPSGQYMIRTSAGASSLLTIW